MPGQEGLLIIVTGPSAVGKGAICDALMQRTGHVRFSVSVTTRPPRHDEVDGVEYYFVSRAEFIRRRDAGEFIEWAEVYGNLYGTPKAGVAAAIARGEDIILDIDLVGATSVRAQFPAAVSVFVIPPSMDELAARMGRRGTENAADVAGRLAQAPHWIRHGLTYDYVLVNADLDLAVRQLQAIIVAERCRTKRRGTNLINALLEKGVADTL